MLLYLARIISFFLFLYLYNLINLCFSFFFFLFLSFFVPISEIRTTKSHDAFGDFLANGSCCARVVRPCLKTSRCCSIDTSFRDVQTRLSASHRRVWSCKVETFRITHVLFWWNSYDVLVVFIFMQRRAIHQKN